MTLPAHLSVSSIQTYARCPAQWHRRYVLKIQDPPTAPMAFGKAFATALEALHKHQDAEAAWVQAHAAALPGIHPSAEFGLTLLRLYRERGVIAGVPEQRFRLKLPDRSLPPLLGFMDLMTPRGVVEVKTSAARWDQTRCDAELQAAAYAWAFGELNKRPAEHVRYLVFSTRTPSLTEILTYPGANELRLFELAAIAAWDGITGGRFDGCGRCALCKPAAAYDGPTLEFKTGGEK